MHYAKHLQLPCRVRLIVIAFIGGLETTGSDVASVCSSGSLLSAVDCLTYTGAP